MDKDKFVSLLEASSVETSIVIELDDKNEEAVFLHGQWDDESKVKLFKPKQNQESFRFHTSNLLTKNGLYDLTKHNLLCGKRRFLCWKNEWEGKVS